MQEAQRICPRFDRTSGEPVKVLEAAESAVVSTLPHGELVFAENISVKSRGENVQCCCQGRANLRHFGPRSATANFALRRVSRKVLYLSSFDQAFHAPVARITAATDFGPISSAVRQRCETRHIWIR